MLLCNLFEISCSYTNLNPLAGSSYQQCYAAFLALFLLLHSLSCSCYSISHAAYRSVSRRCLPVHMNDDVLSTDGLLLSVLWRNFSCFLRLLSHNTSAALIPAQTNPTNAVTSSPDRGSSPGLELLAIWIASGLVTLCQGESVMRHALTCLFCLSVFRANAPFLSVFPPNHYYQ